MKALIQERTAQHAPEISRKSAKTLNIVFFTHPEFLGHVSMPRFSGMLAEGMRRRGHRVETLFPQAKFFNLPLPKKLKKWSGYIDQYLLFPKEIKKKLDRYPNNTLFVFTDNALGPWVPLVADRPHVIHCHDFMAQEAALGRIPECSTGWTGRQYQKLIFKGYSKGKNFISGSQNTQKILQQFLPGKPTKSELVYNGLHQSFELFDTHNARAIVGMEFGLDLTAGYILHVGGNQWYKNRAGVIEMYDAWRSGTKVKLPLILIGLPPSSEVLDAYSNSWHQEDIHFVTNAKDKIVNLAYSGATVFLFPSCAEGFGWPIAEAMASGCPTITTNEAPMTEVAGDAGYFIPKRPYDQMMRSVWAKEGAKVINHVVNLPAAERRAAIQAGIENAKRFDTETALNRIEEIYLNVVDR